MSVAERLRLSIAREDLDEDGWIVARVVEVPGALSQGRSRSEASAVACGPSALRHLV